LLSYWAEQRSTARPTRSTPTELGRGHESSKPENAARHSVPSLEGFFGWKSLLDERNHFARGLLQLNEVTMKQDEILYKLGNMNQQSLQSASIFEKAVKERDRKQDIDETP